MALSYEAVSNEFDEAFRHLRAALRVVSELRIADNMGQAVPDITEDATWLINTGRYDHARNLITLHENYIEAGVNLKLAESRRDYVGVVEGEPEYLTREDGGEAVRMSDLGQD
jgi:hypothetical protein